MNIAWRCGWLTVMFALACSVDASAQTVSQRGYVDAKVRLFPQAASNDATRAVFDLVVRDDVFYKPKPWLQVAGGLRLRANSHDQVADSWSIDTADQDTRRPPLSMWRLSGVVNRGPLTVEVGRQFVRWGKTDIVTPTDRFAPRDYVDVLDPEFLPIGALRGAVQAGDEDTVEVVWAPRFTPSRTPLFDQRWTVVPPGAAGISIVDAGAVMPSGSQTGVRWAHAGLKVEYALAYFDGFTHLPTLETEFDPSTAEVRLTRVYPAIRMYGGDLAVPNRWFTVKAETGYFTTSSPLSDDLVLYVVQIERQSGEWVFVGGYAGEVVTRARSTLTFAPDRGLSRAFVSRASYTIDVNRRIAFEAAARQNGHGVYANAEYSQAHGQHLRVTMAVSVIGGREDDFLGQYDRNSNASVTLRYSF